MLLGGDFEIGLGSKPTIDGVFSNVFEISFVLYSVFEDQIVLYCWLLLAYSSRIHFISLVLR